MFTSERLLLPCAVGNQLLRTGETPFVPSAVPLQAELSATRATAAPAATTPLLRRHEAFIFGVIKTPCTKVHI